MKLVLHIDDPHARKGIGNKGLSLRKLHEMKLPVPETWFVPVTTVDALKTEVSGEQEAKDSSGSIVTDARKKGSAAYGLRKELDQIIDSSITYAVRSSGELEDSKEHSFAGQFSTFLDLKGSDDVLEAIGKIKATADAALQSDYSKMSQADTSLGGMAVIIQEMVPATWSGVAFSINPITGRNEIVFEAVQGAGTLLVEDGVNPERWIWHQGTWEDGGPDDEPLRIALEKITENIPGLRKRFKAEVDIEWAFDGRKIWFLQCRPVTTSEFPTIYSNHISREVLPGLIKPLVWSVNIPLVNSAWLRLLQGLLGRLNIEPEQLSASYYYRAYFNMGTLGELFNRMGLPRNSLESLMGRKDPSGKSSFKPGLKTMKYMPTIIGFMFSNLFLRRKFLRRFKQLTLSTSDIAASLEKAGAEEYFTLFQRLRAVASEAAYYNIVIPLAMQISNRMLQGKMKRRDIPFEQINFAPDYPALSDYDPGQHIPKLRSAWLEIPAEVREGINGYKDLEEAAVTGSENHENSLDNDSTMAVENEGGINGKQAIQEFIKTFRHLLYRFGHFSESGNDFSYTPWREDPDFLFNMVKSGEHLSKAGEFGSNEDASSKNASVTSNTPGLPRAAFHRAGRYRLYREMISSEYTRCYGLFRVLFLKTGAFFVDKGWLEEATDVFYLTLEEHDALLKGMEPDAILNLGVKIKSVKDEMKRYKDVSLPSVVYGETPPPIAIENSTVYEGIATSPGIFEGELVVVKGYDDFKKDVGGKILIIPFSDVGWTPLLLKAGAIVSESGGMLSHASIIAREMKVPAISSVDHACNLADGTQAMIDGFNGKLILK